MQDKTLLMGIAPVPRLILRFALSSMGGLMVHALYNIVDSFFIGRYVGPDGLAPLSVAFPLGQMVVIAFASLIGVGTASQILRHLGARDYARAQLALGNGLFASALCLCLVMLPLALKMPQAIMLCGARGHGDAHHESLPGHLHARPSPIFSHDRVYAHHTRRGSASVGHDSGGSCQRGPGLVFYRPA